MDFGGQAEIELVLPISMTIEVCISRPPGLVCLTDIYLCYWSGFRVGQLPRQSLVISIFHWIVFTTHLKGRGDLDHCLRALSLRDTYHSVPSEPFIFLGAIRKSPLLWSCSFSFPLIQVPRIGQIMCEKYSISPYTIFHWVFPNSSVHSVCHIYDCVWI